jgi:hypothetical protein
MTAAIETRYAGCRFRSRLEARWAVFFNHLGVEWQYEPQGFVVDGIPYLPDFLLPECGTWVEVKGAESELDHSLMVSAAKRLPDKGSWPRRGPALLILGPVPDAPAKGDLGWIGIDCIRTWDGAAEQDGQAFGCHVRRGLWECGCGWRKEGADPARRDLCEHMLAFIASPDGAGAGGDMLLDQWWGFGTYSQGRSLQVLRDTSCPTPVMDDSEGWLKPASDEYAQAAPGLAAAYTAARSARFEHGESGASS